MHIEAQSRYLRYLLGISTHKGNWSCHFLVVTNKINNTTTPYLSSILNIVADPEVWKPF